MGSWYFRHDYKAKSDSKILELEVEFGEHVGYALWFKLLECMGEAGGFMPFDKIGVYSLVLRISKERLQNFIDYCIKIGLLHIENESYVNTRFSNECQRISERSEKASASANKRWKHNDQIRGATKMVNPKKEPAPDLFADASDMIKRLRSFALAIFADVPNCKNKPELTPDQYQQLIDKWGYDKLVMMQKAYYEWKASLAKKHTHTDIGTLLKGGWVLDKIDGKIPTKDDIEWLKHPSGQFFEDNK